MKIFLFYTNVEYIAHILYKYLLNNIYIKYLIGARYEEVWKTNIFNNKKFQL